MAFFNRFLDNFGQGLAAGVQSGFAQKQQLAGKVQSTVVGQTDPDSVEAQVNADPKRGDAIRAGANTTNIGGTQEPIDTLEALTGKYQTILSAPVTGNEDASGLINDLSNLDKAYADVDTELSNFSALSADPNLLENDPRYARIKRGQELVATRGELKKQIQQRISDIALSKNTRKEQDAIYKQAISSGNTDLVKRVIRQSVTNGYIDENTAALKAQGAEYEIAANEFYKLGNASPEEKQEYILTNPLLAKHPEWAARAERYGKQQTEDARRASVNDSMNYSLDNLSQSSLYDARDTLNDIIASDTVGGDPYAEEQLNNLNRQSRNIHRMARTSYDTNVAAYERSFFTRIQDRKDSVRMFVISHLKESGNAALALAAVGGDAKSIGNIQGDQQKKINDIIDELQNVNDPQLMEIARDWARQQADVTHPGMREYNEAAQTKASASENDATTFYRIAQNHQNPEDYLRHIALESVVDMDTADAVRDLLMKSGQISPDFAYHGNSGGVQVDLVGEDKASIQQQTLQEYVEEAATGILSAKPEERAGKMDIALKGFVKAEAKGLIPKGGGVSAVGLLSERLGGKNPLQPKALVDISTAPPSVAPTGQVGLAGLPKAPAPQGEAPLDRATRRIGKGADMLKSVVKGTGRNLQSELSALEKQRRLYKMGDISTGAPK